MKVLLMVMGAVLLVAGCGDGGDESDRDASAMHDSMGAGDAGHMNDSGMEHEGDMSGDRMPDMGKMNAMMVSMLGGADSAYEMRFIDLMVPHHQGAVMMAEDALTKAQHPELKAMAKMMIDAQRSEIAQFKSWRGAWYGDSTVAPMAMEGMKGMDMAQMGGMMTKHLGAADSGYDDRFIDMMIPHHQGAVMMAEDALTKAGKPELKALAKKIIADQNKEIAQMEEWRKEWYGH